MTIIPTLITLAITLVIVVAVIAAVIAIRKRATSVTKAPSTAARAEESVRSTH